MNRRTLVASTLAAIPASLPLAAKAEPAPATITLGVAEMPMNAGYLVIPNSVPRDAKVFTCDVHYKTHDEDWVFRGGMSNNEKTVGSLINEFVSSPVFHRMRKIVVYWLPDTA